MHTVTIDLKVVHEFDGEQVVVYDRVWKKEREGGTFVIIGLSKINNKNI